MAERMRQACMVGTIALMAVLLAAAADAAVATDGQMIDMVWREWRGGWWQLALVEARAAEPISAAMSGTPTGTATQATPDGTVSPTGSVTATTLPPLGEPLILQQGLNGYLGASDTYVDRLFPNRPQGVQDADRLWLCSGMQNALLRFDLAPLPARARVLTATLRVKSYSANTTVPMQVQAYRVLRPWLDTEATWNVARGEEAWGEAGCTGAGSDRAVEPCAMETLTTGGRWYDFDVTSAVQSWAEGATFNYGLVLIPSESANYHILRSSEWRLPQDRPKLEISYIIPTLTPTSTATPTLTGTPTPTRTATPTPTLMPTLTPTLTATQGRLGIYLPVIRR